MKYENKNYGFVTMKDGVAFYRSHENPKEEIEVNKGKVKKLKSKIKNKK